MAHDSSSLSAEPIEATAAPLTKRQFNREVLQIRRSFEASNFAWCVGCAKVAELLERGIEGIEHETSYLAKCLGITADHARRLRRFGDVCRLIGPITPRQLAGPTDPESGRPVFNEYQIRPLAGLLAEKPDLVPIAYEDALRLAGGEPLTHNHTKEAVGKLLGKLPKRKNARATPGDDMPPDDELDEDLLIPVDLLDRAIRCLALASTAISDYRGPDADKLQAKWPQEYLNLLYTTRDGQPQGGLY